MSELKAPEWMDRCDECGWPLKEDRSAGCHEFDCSFRPREGTDEYRRWKAGQSLNATERKLSRDYIRQLQTKLRNAQRQRDGLANFNPDWDMLEATQESLREHQKLLSEARDEIRLKSELIEAYEGGLNDIANLAPDNGKLEVAAARLNNAVGIALTTLDCRLLQPKAQRIELYCTKCESRKTVERQDDDPPEAVLAHVQCPECVVGDFDSTEYFDAKGEPVAYVEPASDNQTRTICPGCRWPVDRCECKTCSTCDNTWVGGGDWCPICVPDDDTPAANRRAPDNTNLIGPGCHEIPVEPDDMTKLAAAVDEHDYESLYYELIMEVANKWPGESRHETAKRYIGERETPDPSACASAATSQPRTMCNKHGWWDEGPCKYCEESTDG